MVIGIKPLIILNAVLNSNSKKFQTQRTVYDYAEYDMPKKLPSSWSIGSVINFTLSNDIDVIGTINSFQFISNNHIFVSGTLPNYGWFEASSYENIINANIAYPGNIQYELRPSKIHRSIDESMQTYMMRQANVKEEYFANDLDNDVQIGTKAVASKVLNSFENVRMITSPTLAQHYQQRTTGGILQLKLLILYTKDAVIDAGSESNLLATITLGVGNFNSALRNSMIDVNVVYVAERMMEYDTYQEPSDLSTILHQMNDGVISTAVRLAAVGAHAVQLIVGGGDSSSNVISCGASHYDFNGDTNGMSVSLYGCMGGYSSLAHEIGHNIGLHHDLTTHTSRGINHGYCWDDSYDSSSSSSASSNNYQNSDGDKSITINAATAATTCKRSVMANSQCATSSGLTNCDRVAYFSTPDISIDSSAGNSGSSSGRGSTQQPIGETIHCNNAQHFRNNIDYFISLNNPTPDGTDIDVVDTIAPTSSPSHHPSVSPVASPSYVPTKLPHTTKIPTKTPSFRPTLRATTITPSSSFASSIKPTYQLTVQPTLIMSDDNNDDNNDDESLLLPPTIVPSVSSSSDSTTLKSIPSSIPTKRPHRVKTLAPSSSPSLSPSSLIPTTGIDGFFDNTDDYTNGDTAAVPPVDPLPPSLLRPPTLTPVTATATPTPPPALNNAWFLPTYSPTTDYDFLYPQPSSSANHETLTPTFIVTDTKGYNSTDLLFLFGDGNDVIGEIVIGSVALIVLLLMIYGIYSLHRSRQSKNTSATNNDDDDAAGNVTMNSNGNGKNVELHFATTGNHGMNTTTPQPQVRSKVQAAQQPSTTSSSSLSYISNSIMKSAAKGGGVSSSQQPYKRLVTQEESEELDDFYKDVDNDDD